MAKKKKIGIWGVTENDLLDIGGNLYIVMDDNSQLLNSFPASYFLRLRTLEEHFGLWHREERISLVFNKLCFRYLGDIWYIIRQIFGFWSSNKTELEVNIWKISVILGGMRLPSGVYIGEEPDQLQHLGLDRGGKTYKGDWKGMFGRRGKQERGIQEHGMLLR